VTSVVDIASSDEIALFNPAFVARLLHRSASDLEQAGGTGMSISLMFLAVPLVLHKPTRDDLPSNAASQMQQWIREHPRHMAGLTDRVLSLRPFTGIAVRFGLAHGLLAADGPLVRAGSVRRKPPGFNAMETDEVDQCLRTAGFIGRWFARQPDAATLLAWWGLRP
jgi:hypothetical protein